ncbi:MAG: hypothetical protein V4447_08490 [Pseudomonadota bacterium]
MNPYQTIPSALLNNAGLNCHAVFNIAELTPEVRELLTARCPQAGSFRQLILIGHGGTTFWQALQATGRDLTRNETGHPVDEFTVAKVQEFLQTEFAGIDYEIVYPGSYTVSLQELGKLAGWHHPSPFMVGINASFGSWFAYRAVVLANTDLPATTAVQSESPCTSCSEKPCISNCPAHALDDGEFNLIKCVGYRQQTDSLCKNTCIARTSCPVASEHKYSEAQINYHYGRSMKVIDGLKTA